jgi:hypothetical protein
LLNGVGVGQAFLLLFQIHNPWKEKLQEKYYTKLNPWKQRFNYQFKRLLFQIHNSWKEKLQETWYNTLNPWFSLDGTLRGPSKSHISRIMAWLVSCTTPPFYTLFTPKGPQMIESMFSSKINFRNLTPIFRFWGMFSTPKKLFFKRKVWKKYKWYQFLLDFFST